MKRVMSASIRKQIYFAVSFAIATSSMITIGLAQDGSVSKSTTPKTSGPAKETTIEGKVTKIIDGDSIIVVGNDKKEYEVQIEGTDAPETKQPFGKESTEALSKMLKDKKVKVTWEKADNFDRLLAQVFVDDKHANLEMIKSGMAWHFKRYNKSEVLAKAETEAKEAKRGLWADEKPTAPWDYRKENRTPDAPVKKGN